MVIIQKSLWGGTPDLAKTWRMVHVDLAKTPKGGGVLFLAIMQRKIVCI